MVLHFQFHIQYAVTMAYTAAQSMLINLVSSKSIIIISTFYRIACIRTIT